QPGASEPPKKRRRIDADDVNDEELNKFWRALKDASHKQYLRLSGSTRFLGKEHGFSALKIRKCYRDLLSVVFDDSINKLRITGNPGIGKTFFGYYLLYQLALKDATVVYDNFNEIDPIVFEGGKGAFTSDSVSIKSILKNKAVWYIVDGKEAKDVNAKTILICSPKRKHYKRFDKYHNGVVTIRYMPIWNWKEIKNCRKMLYDDKVTLELAKDLFSKWGGIPRYVLERANDETHQSKLIDAIKGCKVKIFDDIGEKCIERSETSHMIAHIDVNPSYKEVILRFASNYVRERVTDKLETSIRARLLEKTKAGTGNSLLGSVFEYIAHRTLWNGGKFDVRPLDKYEDNNNYDSDAIVNLPKQDLPLYFHKTRIDVIEDGVYYQPQESNFPSVDSIIAPNKVFQMTIAKRHSIKMNGLKILYDKFGGESADHLIYYYFVVPEHIYDDYKTQNIANSDGVDAQIIPGWIDDRIFQYVLKIKL
ncbi:hypothetical protein RhiirC2_796830, partial [Rhizophagus irregularis]